MVEISATQATSSNPTAQTTTTTTTPSSASTNKTSACIKGQLESSISNQDHISVESATAGVAAATGVPLHVSDIARAFVEPQPSTSVSGYQLRAFTNKPTSGEENLWSSNLNVPSLSADLIDETLSYFVNCRHRLSQITRTFDDSDAYILLLQEKEMDLELVARIGQDLLKQFNEVKDSNEGLKDELAKFHELNERLKDELARCQEDNQQLRYELSSKASLLDTFMEEEEHLHHRDTAATLNRSDANDEEYTSLRSQSDRVTSTHENNLYKRLCELQDELLTKDDVLFKQNLAQQEKNLHLELQLRESERRLSGLEAENETLRENQKELYEELKTYSRNFAELLRIFSESQRESRMHDVGNSSFDCFTEQPSSFSPHLNSTTNFVDNQPYDTQQQPQQRVVGNLVRDSSGNMVMSTSLHEEMQASLLKPGKMNDVDDENDDNIDCDYSSDPTDSEIKRVTPPSPRGRHHRNYNHHHSRTHQTIHVHSRAHLHQTDSDSGGVSDGTDSGLHTTNISTSTTPINNGLNLDTDSEDASSDGSCGPEDVRAKHRRNWLGLSTFTLTTLLLLCLSATLNTSTNSNLAQKLQLIKFDR